MDYASLEDEQLEFLPGSVRECAVVSIIDDVILEPTEIFIVDLTSSDGDVIVSSPQQAVVSILDNDDQR